MFLTKPIVSNINSLNKSASLLHSLKVVSTKFEIIICKIAILVMQYPQIGISSILKILLDLMCRESDHNAATILLKFLCFLKKYSLKTLKGIYKIKFVALQLIFFTAFYTVTRSLVMSKREEEFIADHPFFYIVLKNKLILFIGKLLCLYNSCG